MSSQPDLPAVSIGVSGELSQSSGGLGLALGGGGGGGDDDKNDVVAVDVVPAVPAAAASSESAPTAPVVITAKELDATEEDLAIMEQVWGGIFPAVVVLDSDEVTTLRPPAPLYMLVPRCGYFASAAHASGVLDHLLPHADVKATAADLWLSHSTVVPSSAAAGGSSSSSGAAKARLRSSVRPVPVTWHIPAGVLYDCRRVAAILQATPRGRGSSALFGPDGEGLVVGADVGPLALEAHFQQFPKAQVFRMVASPDSHDDQQPEAAASVGKTLTVRQHFFNSLKEASFIRHGDSHAVNSLSVEESDSLWEAVLDQSAARFLKATKKKLAVQPGRLTRVPLRVYVNGDTSHLLQEPVVPYDANGEVRPLGDVLLEVLRIHAMLKAPSAAAVPGEGPYVLLTDPDARSVRAGEVCAVVHGVSVPLDTPITWLVNYMCHPDQFVYIVLALRPV